MPGLGVEGRNFPRGAGGVGDRSGMGAENRWLAEYKTCIAFVMRWRFDLAEFSQSAPIDLCPSGLFFPPLLCSLLLECSIDTHSRKPHYSLILHIKIPPSPLPTLAYHHD